MSKKSNTDNAAPFFIPAELAHDQAADNLKRLRARLDACGSDETVTLDIDDEEPGHLALELLHAAAKSAAQGAPLKFGARAETLLGLARATPSRALPDADSVATTSQVSEEAVT